MAIINEPKLQSSKQKAADNTIITIGLAVFSFFLIMLTLALWGAAGTYFYNYLFTPQDVEATINMLIRLTLVGSAVFIIMLLWSKYNLVRFGSLNRRRAVPPPSLEETGTLYAIESEPVALAQTFKSATIEVKEEGLVLCSYQGKCFSTNAPTAK
ncbi:poly-beta-1,6-N-acetyl-D-glucosamine biosynthesis protein PgaD [Pelosinus sp. UFO1]|uniref:poly-beta-1,6-N-acetyl-D-glucosamine biosynthesis protein PgaD n=1 Tax=Pelosinus sp. UFO1 TaxID=484770 RepID=UPI0004D14FE5|nr:poly-beta-1,6-N-acetyl-D-glucosamine biosynthesis protein PgaD [Pelosinus sp. UFO1]AIF53355.1 Poly-beta-1,6-N-acetyl-D-glucosamine biosynthesis protein PgaD [Pelosinus sp. UFO1]